MSVQSSDKPQVTTTLPGAWLGLLGGGQLGRMFVQAAQRMGYKVLVLDPTASGPAAQVADDHIQAAYTDRNALDQVMTRCEAVTTEFENVPAMVMAGLAKYVPTFPPAEAVAIAQDRRSEKNFFSKNHFPVGSFCIIESMTDLNTAIAKADYTPGILKTARGGYDGLGQVLVWTAEELVDAWSKLGQVPCVLERKLTLESELSVLVARGQDGAVAAWPVQENQHCNGILDVSIVPARQSPELISQAVAEAERLLCLLDYVGVMAVEFFVHRTPNGALEIALNEIAPRPHNSGHYSIEACQTSQFEQQVRTLCGLPLGNTLQHAPAVMVNLLGDIWLKQEPDFHACLSIDGVKLHLYGKSEARAGRKMGHITCLGTTVEEALDKAMRVKKILHIASKADN